MKIKYGNVDEIKQDIEKKVVEFFRNDSGEYNLDKNVTEPANQVDA
ncbi:hypothetical protein [Pedobacter rhizosphaerae]|nr:hypothetical protein [Pedobacter rhizosphaerae]